MVEIVEWFGRLKQLVSVNGDHPILVPYITLWKINLLLLIIDNKYCTHKKRVIIKTEQVKEDVSEYVS